MADLPTPLSVEEINQLTPEQRRARIKLLLEFADKDVPFEDGFLLVGELLQHGRWKDPDSDQ